MLVAAVSGSLRAETAIPIEISATAQPSRADRSNPSFKAPSGSKKWVFFLAAGAGAAAGLAFAGGRSSPPSYSPPAAVVVTPSIGTPTITIGKP
jgi:hypothetical protein